MENCKSEDQGNTCSEHKKNCEERPRHNLEQNVNVPKWQDYIAQISEAVEGRVTKKLSQEFSRRENRKLGALSRVDDFLMNPILQGHSGTAAETSRKVNDTNHGTNHDDSQSDPHPEAGLLLIWKKYVKPQSMATAKN